ncbi:MAG: gamma-glutamyltransferase [Fuerstiella sp.]
MPSRQLLAHLHANLLSAVSAAVALLLVPLIGLPTANGQATATQPSAATESGVFVRPSAYQSSVVAADHQAASEAGAEILRRGGNVVDAAVATSFALSVVRPASCGIGGGGFMVIWDATEQKAVALDYREQAPAAASADMFAGQNGGPEAGSVRGGKAIGIPGTVFGLCHAAETYGSLPLSVLLEPAIRLAKEGVLIDGHDRSAQRDTLRKFDRYPSYHQRFVVFKKLYLNDGVPWKAGDRFYSPLGSVLKRIAVEGADGFYSGEVSAAIARTVAKHGGVISRQDLNSINLKTRIPLHDDYRGHTIYSMPPASSGGIALLQTLQALESWEAVSRSSLRSLRHNSADYVHVVAEAMKHAFADRAEFLGDTDFVDVPVERMISRAYSDQIASKIDLEKTRPLAAYGRFFAANDGGTSHFSVIDAAGNSVACTETINLTYGSFVVVPEYGILLNNEIDDFAAQPGKPNAFGLIQSEANAIDPGKRPLSSMTPTIVVKDGKATYSTGASGGPKIITASIQSVLNHIVFGMSPAESVSAARFHHQWSPNVLKLEESLFLEVAEDLKDRGHDVVMSESMAASQAVAKDQAGLSAGSDPRKHGRPAGQ